MKIRFFGPRVLSAIVIAIALLLMSATADAETVRLHYEAPSESCPTRTWLEGALHFRSSRLTATEEQGDYDADVRVTASSSSSSSSSFHGVLRIGQETTREIDGARCQSVVEALTLTIALLLDPEGVNSGALPSDSELTRIAEAAREKQLATPEDVPLAVATPPVGIAPPVDRLPTPPSNDPHMQIFADIGVGAWSGVRGVAPRGALGVEAQYGRPLLKLSLFMMLRGFLEPSNEASTDAGTIAYTPAGGRIDAGVLYSITRSVRVGGGAHVTLLTMPVDAPSADERLRSVRAVGSLGPMLRALWEPRSSRWALSIEASGGAHFSRERYRIDAAPPAVPAPSGGEVFRLPAIYAEGTIGFVVRFADLKAPFGT